MKETVQICNNGHLLDWMENGTLETVLTEIFTNEHKNFSQSFRFGSKFALDFPSRTEWRITAPNERCHGRFTQKARQYRIKRYILLHNIYHSLVCADEIAGQARNDKSKARNDDICHPGHRATPSRALFNVIPGSDPGSDSSHVLKPGPAKIFWSAPASKGVVISVKRFSVQMHLYESTSTDMCRVLLYRLKEWPR